MHKGPLQGRDWESCLGGAVVHAAHNSPCAIPAQARHTSIATHPKEGTSRLPNFLSGREKSLAAPCAPARAAVLRPGLLITSPRLSLVPPPLVPAAWDSDCESSRSDSRGRRPSWIEWQSYAGRRGRGTLSRWSHAALTSPGLHSIGINCLATAPCLGVDHPLHHQRLSLQP